MLHAGIAYMEIWGFCCVSLFVVVIDERSFIAQNYLVHLMHRIMTCYKKAKIIIKTSYLFALPDLAPRSFPARN